MALNFPAVALADSVEEPSTRETTTSEITVPEVATLELASLELAAITTTVVEAAEEAIASPNSTADLTVIAATAEVITPVTQTESAPELEVDTTEANITEVTIPEVDNAEVSDVEAAEAIAVVDDVIPLVEPDVAAPATVVPSEAVAIATPPETTAPLATIPSIVEVVPDSIASPEESIAPAATIPPVVEHGISDNNVSFEPSDPFELVAETAIIPVEEDLIAALPQPTDAEILGIQEVATQLDATYQLPIEQLTLPVAPKPLKDADVEVAQSQFDTPPPAAPPNAPEAQVLVAEVVVAGAGLTRELENLVYDSIATRPGQTTTRSQLQQDVNEVYATGFFANVTQVPEDTPLGVRVTFQVEVNPVLTRVEAQSLTTDTDNQAVSQEVLDEIFGAGYGQTLNLRDLQIGIVDLNDWYQEQGYDLAQVVGSPEISQDGVVRLAIAEGIVEDIRIRYIDEEEEFTDGRTRPFIVTREMQLKPGDVFSRNIAQQDLQRVFGLGIFEDVRLAFEPGEDPSKVIVNIDVVEGNTGSIAAGAGVSSASGVFGTASYQQRNLGGNNQTLAAEVQLGERELLFDLSFTDPWIAGDPYRTSYTVNMFRRRSISLIFDEGNPEVRLANGDRPRVIRTGGGINFNRPLSKDPFSPAEWTVSTGFQYQGVRVEDSDGRVTPQDSQDNLLSFTNGGRDTLVSLSFGAVRDRRNSALEPTQGSLLRLGMDQTLPIGSGTILFNRLRGNYSHYIPVDWFNLTKDPDAPQALAFNLQGGTVIGDLPPYEAFSLGGANSVRGYREGDVGSGRSYLQATAEYRFPVFSFIGGALFVDYATDLGTGDDVPGNPAGVRNKPGDGLGYGVGVRIQSPLGPIRVDYGLNDEGDSRIHFGIGQRF